MNNDDDLLRIAEQERRLRFQTFDAAAAWRLGVQLKAAAEARGAGVTIEIRLGGQTLFFYAMPGTTPANADWARRKRNTVELLHTSSYAVGLKHQRDGGNLETRMGLPLRDHADHGGSFPLLLEGTGCVGAITVSGLPQREDHALIVEVLSGLCGVPAGELALA